MNTPAGLAGTFFVQACTINGLRTGILWHRYGTAIVWAWHRYGTAILAARSLSRVPA